MDSAAQLFVYYHVRPADLPAWARAARELQAHWRVADPALTCNLSRRAESSGELMTVMETYQHPAGLSAQRQVEIDTLAQQTLALWIVGPRRSEYFVSCA